MKKTFNRMYETFMFEIGLSLIFFIISSKLNVGNRNVLMILLSTFALIANLVWNLICLRKYRYKVKGKDVYYKTNFFVFAVLAIASIIFYFIDIGGIYTYLFLPFEIFYYYGIKSKIISIIITNLIFFLCVYLVPFTVHKGKRSRSQRNSAENKK